MQAVECVVNELGEGRFGQRFKGKNKYRLLRSLESLCADMSSHARNDCASATVPPIAEILDDKSEQKSAFGRACLLPHQLDLSHVW